MSEEQQSYQHFPALAIKTKRHRGTRASEKTEETLRLNKQYFTKVNSSNAEGVCRYEIMTVWLLWLQYFLETTKKEEEGKRRLFISTDNSPRSSLIQQQKGIREKTLQTLKTKRRY